MPYGPSLFCLRNDYDGLLALVNLAAVDFDLLTPKRDSSS